MTVLSLESLAALEELEKGNPPAQNAGLFGASIPLEEANIVIIPVPWDATTSYGSGAAGAPEAIVRASHQLDLLDPAFGRPYFAGISMLPVDQDLISLNARAKRKAESVIAGFETHKPVSGMMLEAVNSASEQINDYVYRWAKEFLGQKRVVGVLGGDHSSPHGLIKALNEEHSFGILHIDAHHDLRVAFEDFTYSHASAMHNVLEECPRVDRLVSVGIRDFSRSEFERARDDQRVATFYSRDLFNWRAEGGKFADIAQDIVKHLPPKVYISFDIDGLDPSYCPSTGTPVPGGLLFEEAVYILEKVVASGRTVIGFDLCEVVPGQNSEWDANVGARILYKLCGAAAKSQKLARE